MRIAVIADTHMPRRATELPPACRTLIARADLVVHAGDLSAPPVLAMLEDLCPHVAAVHGNVDEAALTSTLAATHELELPGLRLGVIHDAGPPQGRAARMARRFPGADAVVFGHSHIPLLEGHEGRWILNPGSPTDPRRQPRPSMAEIVLDGRVRVRHWAVDEPEPAPLGAALVRGRGGPPPGDL